MAWPVKFRMKSRVWEIRYVERLRDMDSDEPENPDNDLLGLTRADLRTIWISLDQCDESMRDTLVHELGHAFYSTMPKYGGDDEEAAEEHWVMAVTEAFFEIVNNSESPWFMG